MEVFEELTNSIDNEQYSVGVFIELKNAFGMIDPDKDGMMWH